MIEFSVFFESLFSYKVKVSEDDKNPGARIDVYLNIWKWKFRTETYFKDVDFTKGEWFEVTRKRFRPLNHPLLGSRLDEIILEAEEDETVEYISSFTQFWITS